MTGLYKVPIRRPEAGNFCFGPVTFQTDKPDWLIKILCDVISDSIARFVSLQLGW